VVVGAIALVAFPLSSIGETQTQVRGRWIYDRDQVGRALAAFRNDGLRMLVTESGALPYRAGWHATTARQLGAFLEPRWVEAFKQTTGANVADFCLEMYRQMGLLDGIRVARSSDPAIRRAACDVSDFFVDVPHEGEVVRARWIEGELKLHEGGERYLTLPAVEFTKEQLPLLKPLCLITAKPAMFVGNVSEDGFENNPYLDKLREYAAKQNAPVVVICAKMEAEMADMSDEDKKMFLAEIGQEEPGLNRLIRAAFKLLGLQTYFTAGVKEVRAWTIHIGDTGPQAAGVIHTDFERGYIRAQTIAFDDFIANQGEQGAKDAGKMRSEGKEYVVKDGDVMNFLFNV
jgi:hypothetical protein